MPLFFLGTREWRNRQTRTVQVRVPVMEWGFNSPLAHDETADPSGSAVFVFPGCGLWPRWCSGRRRARPLCVPVGGGPPASRPRCELRSARRLEARPGPATAHRHRGRSLRRPLHLWGRVTVRQLYASSRSPARPRHRPWEPKPGPPLPVGVMGVSRVEFFGCSGACCDKRRQSKVFFVWLSAALL